MNEPLTIWTIRSSYYDGAGIQTDSVIAFELTEEKAETYIENMFNSDPIFQADYQWEYIKDFTGEEQRVYILRFGRYGYQKYFAAPMTEGEYIDW